MGRCEYFTPPPRLTIAKYNAFSSRILVFCLFFCFVFTAGENKFVFMKQIDLGEAHTPEPCRNTETPTNDLSDHSAKEKGLAVLQTGRSRAR